LLGHPKTTGKKSKQIRSRPGRTMRGVGGPKNKTRGSGNAMKKTTKPEIKKKWSKGKTKLANSNQSDYGVKGRDWTMGLVASDKQ